MAEKKKEKQFKPYVKKSQCPKCGPGHALADHAMPKRRHCGKCGYTEML